MLLLLLLIVTIVAVVTVLVLTACNSNIKINYGKNILALILTVLKSLLLTVSSSWYVTDINSSNAEDNKMPLGKKKKEKRNTLILRNWDKLILFKIIVILVTSNKFYNLISLLKERKSVSLTLKNRNTLLLKKCRKG